MEAMHELKTMGSHLPKLIQLLLLPNLLSANNRSTLNPCYRTLNETVVVCLKCGHCQFLSSLYAHAIPAIKRQNVFLLSLGSRLSLSDSLTNRNTDILGNSLVVQWLRFHAPNAGGPGFNYWNQILHAATKSSHATTKSSHAATKDPACQASLMVQWLRIRLPMQETWVRALVWEDPTCRRANKPMRHNY